ncbi:hypothetical protein [Nannocystis sp.]|uniref:hypothetical protein n=1 Tax=Nannocystis sp. TaxID=1962667 RepID=UPI002426DEE5|nr:hypothetical protein [Nannocystis sp.]MBK7826530.1 hypothetical protein [Nannocystis sp.]MBK9754152.1 hypothetical protein [Nannocystis sp.]
MHYLSSAHRLRGSVALVSLLSLASACGDDKSNVSGFSSSISASQPTQASSDPSATGGETGGVTTGEVSATTQGPGETSSDPVTTTGVDPSTTTGVDPSTTNVDPSTTTGVDPSTTNVDPSTTTGDPPDPKDPQPADGLYESCLDNTPCNVNLTDGCFTITDAMTMKVIDGYCTLLCNQVADCGPAPKAPAVQECLTISLNPAQKVCALKCTGVADCPIGMACTGLALPNNMNGNYCT